MLLKDKFKQYINEVHATFDIKIMEAKDQNDYLQQLAEDMTSKFYVSWRLNGIKWSLFKVT